MLPVLRLTIVNVYVEKSPPPRRAAAGNPTETQRCTVELETLVYEKGDRIATVTLN